MPVSLNPDDALQSFGIQAGLHRIVSADYMVHEFSSTKTGETWPPFVCLAIGYLPIDERGQAIGNAEVSYDLKIAPGFGESLDKAKFAPASEPGRPLPLTLGMKGRFIEPIKEQSGFYSNSNTIRWMNQLVACADPGGANPQKRQEVKQKLSAGDVSVLIGTEGFVERMSFKNEGNTSDGQPLKDSQIPVFKSVRKWGWEAGAIKTMPQSAAQPVQSAAPVNGSPAVPADAKEVAKAFLKVWSTDTFAKDASVSITEAIKKKLLPVYMSKLHPRPTPQERDAAKALLQDETFYQNNSDVQEIAFLEGDQLSFIR